MTIETKFRVNDLVQHKFQRKSELTQLDSARTTMKFFEVLYIHTETCSAGTQVFYKVRPFFPIVESGFKTDPKITDLGFGAGSTGTEGTLYYREDELKPMSNEEKTFYGVDAGG